jgi:hypothetical protein
MSAMLNEGGWLRLIWRKRPSCENSAAESSEGFRDLPNLLTTVNDGTCVRPSMTNSSVIEIDSSATFANNPLVSDDLSAESGAFDRLPDGSESVSTWTMSRLERRSWLVLLGFVAVVYVCATTVADPDLWGHTLYGLRALELGVLVEPTDPFSYTAAGARWVNHEWLTELQYGWLWKHFGSVGLVVWRDLLMIGVFAFAALSFRDARASIGTAVILWLYSAQCLSGFCVFVRPQVATFFLFACTLWILRRQWDRPRTAMIWILPLLSVAWVNLHGGFLAGMGLVGLFSFAAIVRALGLRLDHAGYPAQSVPATATSGRERSSGTNVPAAASNAVGWHANRLIQATRAWVQRFPAQASSTRALEASGVDLFEQRWPWRIVLVGAGCMLATLVNPYGFELYEMLWTHLITEQAVREWQPLWAARQAPFYYLPFILLAIALGGSRRWQWIDLVVLLAVGYQAVSHIRHVALLCIAVIILMPGPLSDGLARCFRHFSARCSGDDRWRWRAVWIVGAVFLVVLIEAPATLRIWREGAPPWGIAVESTRNSPGVPLRAIQVLEREKIEGNLLTAYGWGQYLLWHRFPQNRIGFDGRYRTVYPQNIEDAFLAFRDLPRDHQSPTPILDQYPTQIILWPTIESTCDYLEARSDWVEVYGDEQARLFVRDLPQFASLIERVKTQRLTTSPVPLFTPFPGGPVTQPVQKLAHESVNQPLHPKAILIPRGDNSRTVEYRPKAVNAG